MKRIKDSIRRATWLVALAVMPVQAADVTVEWITEAGKRARIVSGSVDYPIVHVVSPRGIDVDIRFIDACGDVFGFEEDMLGERRFAEPLEPRHEVRDIMAFFSGSYDGILFGNDRLFYELDVSERNRELMGLENFHFRSVAFESELPLSRVEAIWSRRTGGFYFARMDDGNLMAIKSFTRGNEHARLLEPKKGWGDVTDLVAGEYVHQKGGAGSDVFVTLHADGRLVRHFYGENPSTNNYDIESHEVEGSFSDIRRMLFVTGTRAEYGADYSNYVMAWTDNGSFVKIDIDTGRREHIGEAGSFKGERVIPLRNRYGAYLVSASGDYRECPAIEAPEVVEEVDPADTPDGKAIIAAADEIKAIHEAQHAKFIERIEKGYPDDLWDKNKAQLTTVLMPWLDELKQFEADVVEPMREKVDAFVEKYGDRGEANAKLKSYTGSDYYLGMELGELQEDLESYAEYRRDVAETIAREGRTFFQMAGFMSGADAANNFAKAMPYAELALLFDADNALAKEIAAKAEEKAEFARAAEEAAIAAAVWPEDEGNFEFDADAMKEKILAFFQKHHKDEDHSNGARYFAIRLRSGWVPGKVNILGHLLEWRIGAYIAKTIPGDPDHALVIPVQVGTQTNRKDSPFEYRYFSSASYRIPIDRVPPDDSDVL